METYYIQSADSLLTTSNLVPVDGVAIDEEA